MRGVVFGWLITLHTQVCENDTCIIYIYIYIIYTYVILCKLGMHCSNAMGMFSTLYVRANVCVCAAWVFRMTKPSHISSYVSSIYF